MSKLFVIFPVEKSTTLAKKFKAKSYYVQCPKIQKMVQQLMNHFFHYDSRNQGVSFPTHNIFTKNHQGRKDKKPNKKCKRKTTTNKSQKKKL